MSQPVTCPICRKTLASDAACESEYYPFCSERCRHVDFFRWSEGKYAIVEPLTQVPDGVDLLDDRENQGASGNDD